MRHSTLQTPAVRRALAVTSQPATVASALGACSRGERLRAPDGGGEKTSASRLITKDSTNPFFVAMQKGAKADAGKNNVKLTVASGKQEGDDQGQITAIEDAIARGDKGILITPMSDRRQLGDQEGARRRASTSSRSTPRPTRPTRSTSPSRPTTARPASSTASGPRPSSTASRPTIALLDLFNDKIVSVDYNRDQGFLEGMGIDVADPKKNGDEAKTGKYTGGKGGDYTIVCNEAGQRRRGRRPHRHGEVPGQEPQHQPRLHDQRADRGRRQRRPQGGRQDGDHRLGRRRLRRRRAASRAASSVPPPSSTR